MTDVRFLPATRASTALTDSVEFLREEDRKNARARLSENTHRSYDCQWARFVDWCLRCGYSPTVPVPASTLLEYLTRLGGQGKSISTLRTVMAAVAHEHVKVNCHDSPTQSVVIRDRIKGLVRRRAAERKNIVRKAEPVTLEDLRALGQAPDVRSRVATLRDRALLLLGFAAGFRRSELVGLDVDDVRLVDGGSSLDVFVYRSKTDQAGKGVTVPVYPTFDPSICPVRAWREWRTVHTAAHGPAFVAVHKHGQTLPRRRLGAQVVARIVRDAMARLGATDKRYSGHSLRRGCVTNAVKNDVPLLEIAEHVRHGSLETTRGYVGSRINKGMRNAMNPKKETG